MALRCGFRPGPVRLPGAVSRDFSVLLKPGQVLDFSHLRDLNTPAENFSCYKQTSVRVCSALSHDWTEGRRVGPESHKNAGRGEGRFPVVSV